MVVLPCLFYHADINESYVIKIHNLLIVTLISTTSIKKYSLPRNEKPENIFKLCERQYVKYIY